MAGLTNNGLSVKRLQEVRNEITRRLELFFGEGINTTEDSVFGQVRDSVAPGEASIWEQLQSVYDSQFPSRAVGQQLDDNCNLVGVFRKTNLNSYVPISITGDDGTTIVQGFTVAVNTTKEEFEVPSQTMISSIATTTTLISIDAIANSTVYKVTIDGVDSTYTSDSTATEAEIVSGLITAIPITDATLSAASTSNSNEILISSNDPMDKKKIEVDSKISILKVTSIAPMVSKRLGAIEAPVGQLIDVKTFVSGVDSAVNYVSADLGVLRESDPELRERRDIELAKTASTNILAIYTRVRMVEGVRSCVVLENYTNSTDGNGLSPHSVRVVVDGGEDLDVAQAIFDSKPVGTDMNGNESVAIPDSMGTTSTILFDRPSIVPIFIKMKLTKFPEYPSNGDNDIKNNLFKYGVDNLFSGDDVVTSRLYTPINAVQGHQVDYLYIGLSNPPTGAATLNMSLLQLAQIDKVNIEIV